MAPRVRIRMPKSAEELIRGITNVADAFNDTVRRAKRVVRKAKQLKRAGSLAGSDLRKARPRITVDVEEGEIRLDLSSTREDGEDQ